MNKMFQLFICFACGIFAHNVHGQTTAQKGKVVTIINEITFELNGGARSSFGGKSRHLIPIRLPKGTTTWFYEFTTQGSSEGSKKLELALQLSSLIMTGGVSGMITSSAIKVPPGTGVVDFEILDEKAAQLFTNKGDLASQKYIAYPEGDMTLMKQGVKQVHSIRAGTCFLAIKNPSSLNKIIVTVEAVALVAERSPEQERATLIGNIAWKTYERGDIDQALELSKKAIGIYHDLDFAWANIGLIQLTKRELVAAVDSYAIAAALIKQSDNPDRIFRAVIKDLDDLNVQVPNLAGLLDVRQSPVLSSGLKF